MAIRLVSGHNASHIIPDKVVYLLWVKAEDSVQSLHGAQTSLQDKLVVRLTTVMWV